MTIHASPNLLALIAQQRADRDVQRYSRPASYVRPKIGTEAYRADFRAGWITEDEFYEDEARQMARRGRAVASMGRAGAHPSRWQRPEPQASSQYANQMATTAARDARLTPQAKALLVVLRARCGRGNQTQTTKGTLAAIMGRHVRSIQRYVRELVRFGYIEATPRRGESGLYTGLVVRITEKVLPFFAKAGELAAWLHRTADKPVLPLFSMFSEETKLSSKNDSKKNPSVLKRYGHACGMT